MDDNVPTVDGGVVKGWLEKRGVKGLVKSWKRRFFCSIDSKLHYFEMDGGNSPSLGFIEMTSVLAVSLDAKSGSRRGVFSIITAGRTYSLCANSEAAALAWVETLERFVKDAKERIRAEFHHSQDRIPQVSDPLQPPSSPRAPSPVVLASAPASFVDDSPASLEQQLKLAIADRDHHIEALRGKLAEMEASHSRDLAILKDKLSAKERLAAGLSMQTELLKLVASDVSPDEKAEKLFSAIKERDNNILNLRQMSDLQMKRIRTLELQLSLGSSAAASSAAKTPQQKQAETVNRLVREESMSPSGALGSPSVNRKTRHRRNSSVGSPSTPGPAVDATPVEVRPAASTTDSIATPVSATSVPATLPKSSLQERRAQQTRRAHSMMLPVKEGGAVVGVATPGVNSPLTGEKKLVTPPPWQIKKMIDNVEKRSSLPVSNSPSMVGASSSEVPSSPNVMLGLKSHGNIAPLPGSQRSSLPPPSTSATATVVPLSATVPAKDISVASESNVEPVGPFTETERELAKSLHPLGLPTQGMIRLPHKSKSDDVVLVEEAGGEPKKREGHLGGGHDAAVQTPVRRVVGRSADHWAEVAAAAKVRSAQGGKRESSLPLEVVLPDDKLPVVSEEEASPLRPTEGDSSAVHMTPSFDGLAEKMEELTTPKKSGGSVAPFRGSMAVGHASRFQEQLLEQLRAEQFELLKSLREQKDEAEIQELRMGQLMERIRNGEEIIDEKTRECEEQKVIIRELRKESAQLRARLDAERSRSRSSSMSSEANLNVVPSVKRLQFTDDLDKSSKPSSSPRDSPKKQFQLSDDDQSEEEGRERERPSFRKLSSEYLKSIAKLEDELKKEVLYREALEKQLSLTQQRHNVEDSNLRAKFAAEMEVTIAQQQREKVQMAAELQNIHKKVAEAEKQLAGRTKEIQRLRLAAGEVSSPRGAMKSDLIDAEVQLVQKELQEREEELLVLRKRAQEAETAREVALSSVDALKQALHQTDRELKAMRLQLSQKKSSALGSSPSARETVIIGSAFSPPKEETPHPQIDSVLMAHQEHGALLQRELEAAQREYKAAIGLKDTIIAQTEAELMHERMQRSLLRQRVLQAAREGQKVEQVVEVDWQEEIKQCASELFHSLAVGAKLQQMTLTGSPCNVDVSALMELALERGVHWKSYRTWIQKQVASQQQQQMMSPQTRTLSAEGTPSSAVRLVFTQSPKTNRRSLDKKGHE